MFGDTGSGIIAPETHDWPTVIAARQNDVDLVATVGSIFVVPEHPGLWVDHETQRIAVSKGIDFGPVARVIREWVVARNGAIIVEPKNLAAQTCRVLRNGPNPAASGHVDLVITPESDPAIETRVTFVGLRNQKVSDAG